MNRKLMKLTGVFLSLAMTVGSLSFAPISAAAASPEEQVLALTSKTVTVDLKTGSSNACYNMEELTYALNQADSSTLLTVRLKSGGTYYVGRSSGGGAITLRSNTVLDLNGATIIRSGAMYNLIQNSAFDGSVSKGGYSLSDNITVKNGTLDGTGGSSDEVNLVNLGHASNITFDSVNLKNCRGGHLIELAGCKDAVIKNCTFSGFIGTDTGSNEAIQIDICNNSVAGSWNGVYTSDSTVCKNITVTGCTFNDYPSGVGNHHTIAGVHNSGVTISNNKFLNTRSASQPAIWCYGFDNSKVTGNTITGKYTEGIMVSGGSVSVENNTVSGSSKQPLYITKASSYTLNKYKVITDEAAVNCAAKGNTLKAGSATEAVSLFSGSALTEFSGNTVTSPKYSAVILSGSGTKVNKFNSNSLTSSGDIAVLVASNTVITEMNDNVISGYNHGIQISSNASVQKINSNRSISSTTGSGIYVTSAKAGEIKRNTIRNCAKSGIGISSSGVVSVVQANSISNCKDYGIRINNSSITVGVGQNTFSGNTPGNTNISAKTTTPPAEDTSTLAIPVLKSAVCADGGVTVSWNSVAGAAKYRVFVKKGSETSWTRLADVTSTSYTDVSVQSGVKYSYTVRCVSSDSKSYTSSYNSTGVSVTYVSAPVITSISSAADGVKLSWNAVAGAAKYRVFYKNSSGSWIKLGDTASTTFTDTKVSSGTTYTYTVRCLDSSGNYSSAYKAAGWKGTFVAVPKISSASIETNGIKLNWGAVKGAAKYRVFYKNSSGGWSKLADSASTTVTDAKVSSGTTYTYTVRCLDSSGNYSSAYDATGFKATFVAAPVVTSAASVANGVKLSWNAVKGAAKYRIFYKNGKGGWTSMGDTAATTYTDTKVSSGTTYTYTVRCLNSSGSYCSGYNANGFKGTFVAVPKLSSATSVSNGVKVSWGAVKGAAKYRVFYKNSSGGWSKLGDTTSTSLTDTKVSSGTTYTYTVRCLDSSGNYSSAYDTTGIKGKYIAVPVISSVKSTAKGVELSWSAVKGASKYRVFYKNSKGSWVKLADTASVSYVDSDVRDGGTYTYTLRCLDSSGNYISAYDNTGKTLKYSKPAQTQTLSRTVYWTDSGYAYHYDRYCSHIKNSSNVHSSTTIPAGRTPCKDCA